MTKELDIVVPHWVPSLNKVESIKAIRTLTGFGLKESKDITDVPGPITIPLLNRSYNGIGPGQAATDVFREREIEEQCRILRNNGFIVGGQVHKILQGLRELATDALRQGDDELANEILQLVLVEKLRRK